MSLLRCVLELPAKYIIIMSFVKCRNAELSRVPEQGEVAAVVIRSDDEGDNMTITITAVPTRDLDSIHFDYFKFCMMF